MSCIDLLFCTNQIQFQIMELMSQPLINVTIILSLVSLTSVYHFLQYMQVKSRITVCGNVQMWKISRKQYLTLTGAQLLKIFPQMKELNNLRIILDIFRNYISNKKIKCDYRQPPWINDNIKSSLKQRSKLTKIYDKNGLSFRKI